jgi:hypothetical protein
MAINPDNELEAVWPKNGRYVARFENETPNTCLTQLPKYFTYFGYLTFRFENETPHTVAKAYGVKSADVVQINRAR